MCGQLSCGCHTQVHGVCAGNSPTDVQAYSTPKTIGYMFLIGFTGIFAVTALRKIFIIDYKLSYPSGTATGVLINSLHTPAGAKRVSNPGSSVFDDTEAHCIPV